jgi:hypothetical protein
VGVVLVIGSKEEGQEDELGLLVSKVSEFPNPPYGGLATDEGTTYFRNVDNSLTSQKTAARQKALWKRNVASASQ